MMSMRWERGFNKVNRRNYFDKSYGKNGEILRIREMRILRVNRRKQILDNIKYFLRFTKGNSLKVI